jgi:hypothetical protein
MPVDEKQIPVEDDWSAAQAALAAARELPGPAMRARNAMRLTQSIISPAKAHIDRPKLLSLWIRVIQYGAGR